MYKILEGVRVVEASSWVFLPAAGAILADWGADVIKIEDPLHGDALRGLTSSLSDTGSRNVHFPLLNRGKRSVGIDLVSVDGRAVFKELIQSADVFMTSFRGPARAKLGIEPDDLRAVNPRLVYARGTGQGSLGPDGPNGGYDLASTWARAGLAAGLTPTDGVPPTMPASIGDLTSGVAAAGAIAAALYRRERTGVPSSVEVSLYGMGIWIMSQSIAAAANGADAIMPRIDRAVTPNPLVNCYQTQDKRWIYFVLIEADRYWSDLCRRIGRDELINDPRFVEMNVRAINSRECIKVLDEVFAGRNFEEWREVLRTFDGVWSPMQSPLEVTHDPQVTANGYLSEVSSPHGPALRLPASPMQFDDVPLGTLRPAPEHGQNTEEVLLELGYSWEVIAELKAVKAIM